MSHIGLLQFALYANEKLSERFEYPQTLEDSQPAFGQRRVGFAAVGCCERSGRPIANLRRSSCGHGSVYASRSLAEQAEPPAAGGSFLPERPDLALATMISTKE